MLPRAPTRVAGHSGASAESSGRAFSLSRQFKPRASSTPSRVVPPASARSQARRPRPAGHCVGPAAPAQQRGRGGAARVASPAAARKRQPSPTRRWRAWRAAAACTRPAGWGPRPGGAAGGGCVRPGPARQGYLLHGPLDGGVWGLGLLEQLQDLLKPLLVRFPLILHLGLLQIKPDTGRDEQMLVPRRGPPCGRAPSRCPRPAAQSQPRPQPRLGPETRPDRSKGPRQRPPCLCCAPRPPRAPGADQTESPRICNLAPRSAHGSPLGPSATEHTQTNPTLAARLLTRRLLFASPCKAPVEI